jgi:predicted metal-dependent phosphoesterase TrpH/glycosyltransferase involved in cell wall biosynthesis
VPSETFRIAQVTPYAWEQHHEVNRYVERLSDELCARGHRVTVIAPSESRELISDSRARIRSLSDDAEAAFPAQGCAQVLGVGRTRQMPGSRPAATVSLPIDVSRTIEQLLDRAEFDFVHVHEPYAPSASAAALRHSRALNVGSFHSTTERVLSTQLARRYVELFFGRLDGRSASFQATADLLARFFPSEYRIVQPGADVVEAAARADDGIVDILFSAEEERGALRLFLRALRQLPASLPWRATVWSRLGALQPAIPLARAIRDRVHFAGPGDGSEAQHLSRAHVAVAASAGVSPAPQMLLRALAGGAIPVAARLPEYEEVLREGELGLLFMPRDSDTLAGQINRLVKEESLREEFHRRVQGERQSLSWARVADRFEELYSEIAARRRAHPSNPALRRRLTERGLIDVDLHMHTDHSHDCATPVKTLLTTADEVGLGAIAVTDHNEISGAHAARDLAEREGHRVKIIVAEEVKTADQGEVIGLFIEEKIPRGLTLPETIAEIRRQGGLVYIPHPFDRMHSVPDYEHMLEVVEQIDAIEVFNARVAFSAFNEEAARFAAKYRIAAGAGSDSHVPQGLGSVRIKMRDFDGPEEFLESLREADIVRRKQRLLYVQALKFIQTKGPGAAARRRTGASRPPGTTRSGARSRAGRALAQGRRRPRRKSKE